MDRTRPYQSRDRRRESKLEMGWNHRGSRPGCLSGDQRGSAKRVCCVEGSEGSFASEFSDVFVDVLTIVLPGDKFQPIGATTLRSNSEFDRVDGGCRAVPAID